eukprot:7379022-Prymnesium_polylepis.1
MLPPTPTGDWCTKRARPHPHAPTHIRHSAPLPAPYPLRSAARAGAAEPRGLPAGGGLSKGARRGGAGAPRLAEPRLAPARAPRQVTPLTPDRPK